MASGQIVHKEYMDSFTISKKKQTKKKQSLLATAFDSDAMTNPQYFF